MRGALIGLTMLALPGSVLTWVASSSAQTEAVPSTELGWQGAEAQQAGDFGRAVELFQEACAADDGAACALLGSMYTRHGQGVEPDEERALAYFQLGCAAGTEVACNAVEQLQAARAAAQAQDEPEDQDVALAAEVDAEVEAEVDPSDPVPVTVEQMQNGCDNNDGLDCLTLGYIFRDGNGAPRDFTRAIAMFRKACDISDLTKPYDGHRACHILASYHESGDGVPYDLERALQLYERSCQAGNDDSCSQAQIVRLATGRP